MDYEKIKQAALAASPGPWTLHRQPAARHVKTLTGASHYYTEYIAVVANVDAIVDDEEDVYDYHEFVTYQKGVITDNAGYYPAAIIERDAEFMVAANPAVVLALLEEIERLKSQRSES